MLIGRAGRLSNKSHQVSNWFHALCHSNPGHLFWSDDRIRYVLVWSIAQGSLAGDTTALRCKVVRPKGA